MSLGIECLIAPDHGRALELATKLDRLNRERREIEVGMQESALAMVAAVEAGDGYTLSIHRPEWGPGGVGVLASRPKEIFSPPVFALCRQKHGSRKGSGGSVSPVPLRSAPRL